MDRDPLLGVSVKVNLNSDVGRFGCIVGVGGSTGLVKQVLYDSMDATPDVNQSPLVPPP